MKFKKPKFWDYKKPNFLAYILLPFTLPTLLRNFLLNNFTSKKNEKIKTICIGNIYIGGTGKTPLSIKINELIKRQNFKSTIIKKFYPDQSDEQKLIKKYSNLICKKSRLEGLKEAINENFEYGIFDDGLQDKSINYDLKIVCFNNSQWIGNRFLIPAGPLRERINSIKNYDLVFLNGNTKNNLQILEEIKKISKNISIFETCYKPSNLHQFDLSMNYIALSGIGNPKNFYNTLINSNFKIIKEFIFPDHYEFKNSDIDKIINIAKNQNAEIITTEKDYLRLSKEFLDKIKCLKLELSILDESNFLNLLKHKL